MNPDETRSASDIAADLAKARREAVNLDGQIIRHAALSQAAALRVKSVNERIHALHAELEEARRPKFDPAAVYLIKANGTQYLATGLRIVKSGAFGDGVEGRYCGMSDPTNWYDVGFFSTTKSTITKVG